jgi:hypothetical protein
MHGEVKPGEHSEETRMGAAYRGEEEELAARARDIEDPERRADIISRAAGAPEEPPAVASATLEPADAGWEAGDPGAQVAQRRRGITVKPRDTMAAMAKRANVDLRAFMDANPDVNPRKIEPDQVLNLPVGKRDDDEGIPKPGQNLAEAWGFNMDLSKLNE